MKLRHLIIIATIFLSACNVDLGGERDDSNHDEPNQRRLPQGTVFGDSSIFSTEKGPAEDGSGGGIGVNDLLWRASLDTVSFMPLISADPFGGVIITDWYSPPQTPEERFKINIYILGRALRADGVRATVFRQQNQSGQWIDSPVALNTNTNLENAILTRARQLRLASGQ